MLNVQRLRVLREVAARGSFSAAADSLSLHAVGGLAGRRHARGRDRREADRARSQGRAPHRRRRRAGGPRRRDPVAHRGGRGRAGLDPRGARRPPADGLVPDRRQHPHAARDRQLQDGAPRGRADAGGGRAGGDRAAPARGRVRPRAAVRVPRRRRVARPRPAHASSCSRTRCTSRFPRGHPLAGKRELQARGPAGGGLGADLGLERLRPPRRAPLPRRRLRADRVVRERRLPDGAGPGRRGRGGGADPGAGAHERRATTSWCGHSRRARRCAAWWRPPRAARASRRRPA